MTEDAISVLYFCLNTNGVHHFRTYFLIIRVAIIGKLKRKTFKNRVCILVAYIKTILFNSFRQQGNLWIAVYGFKHMFYGPYSKSDDSSSFHQILQIIVANNFMRTHFDLFSCMITFASKLQYVVRRRILPHSTQYL